MLVDADVQAARGKGKFLLARQRGRHAVGAAVNCRGRLDIVLHALQADPAAGVARERVAEQAVVEDLLDAGGIEHRDHGVHEGEFGLVRRRRAFARVVVAHQGQDAAVPRRAGVVGVAEDVAGPVDAGTLAVPQAEDAVVLAFAAQLGLLRAPDGGRGDVLVEAGLELDVVLLKQRADALERRLEGRDRRAAIARDVARRIEPGLAVAFLLHQKQADDGLRSGQDLAVFRKIELVLEADDMLDH